MSEPKVTEQTVVTLDGPAGSGKSTVARRLAERLGFHFLDTGAMYRAVTLIALRAEVRLEPLDAAGVVAALDAASLRLDEEGRVVIDGARVDEELRTPEVTRWVSQLSVIPAVRERMTAMQRAFGEAARPGVVAEGRDMATVVFPDARHRFYLDADIEERAQRRRGDLLGRGVQAPDLAVLVEQIRERDTRDSSRDIAPLRVAAGVTRVDTTRMTIDDVVDHLERSVQAEAVR